MKEINTVRHLDIEGELSIYTAASIRERLLESLDEETEVEVNLSKVSEIDCAGVQLMISAKREADAHHKILRFIGHSPAVVDILELCDIASHFDDAAARPAQP